MQQVGGLIGGQVGGRAAADGDDPILGLEPGTFRRAAGDDLDDQQGAVLGLQLDAQADKVSLDLRIDVVQLIAGQIGRVLVEAAGGAASIFQNDGGRRQAQLLPGEPDGQGRPRRSPAAGCRSAGFASAAPAAGERRRSPAGRHAALVCRAKCRFAQRYFQPGGAAADQSRPSRARPRSAIGSSRGLRHTG